MLNIIGYNWYNIMGYDNGEHQLSGGENGVDQDVVMTN